MKLLEDRYKDFFGIPPPIGRKSQDSGEESIILESATVVHGENCYKIGCKCTPIKDCNKLDEERWQQHKDSHKGRYVGFRAKRAKKQEQQRQQQQEETQDLFSCLKQDDANPMGDFEPI